MLDLSSAAPDAFADVDRHLLERVGTQLSLAIKNAQLYDEIKRMHLGNLKALSSALNAKDYYTLGHAARVAAYTVMLGRELGWPEDVLAPLEEAAYLHDIGKISISDRVLLKPGRLNQQEWEQMREHPVVSADIIRPLFPEDLVLAVRHHHERYDGERLPGRPRRRGDPARWPAPWPSSTPTTPCRAAARTRPPSPTAECLAELQRCRGTQFDPEMVDAFLRVLEDVAPAARAGRARSPRRPRRASAARRTPRCCALEDEDSEAYREIEAMLREVRDANPPTRFLTTHAQVDKRYVIGVDPEEDETEKSHLGDEIFADDELPQVLAGERPAGQRRVRRRVRRVDHRARARSATRPGRSSRPSRPTCPPSRPPRTRRCAATAARPSPRCCRRRPCASAAPRSTPSPTPSPASTTTATCTSA